MWTSSSSDDVQRNEENRQRPGDFGGAIVLGLRCLVLAESIDGELVRTEAGRQSVHLSRNSEC